MPQHPPDHRDTRDRLVAPAGRRCRAPARSDPPRRHPAPGCPWPRWPPQPAHQPRRAHGADAVRALRWAARTAPARPAALGHEGGVSGEFAGEHAELFTANVVFEKEPDRLGAVGEDAVPVWSESRSIGRSANAPPRRHAVSACSRRISESRPGSLPVVAAT